MDTKLRKGNIIAAESALGIQNLIVSDFDLKENRIFTYCIDNSTPRNIAYSQVLPVKITIHRLKKLGFIQTKKELWEYKNCIAKEHGELFDITIDRDGTYLSAVHELQNFYFKKTGEDIPLNFIQN